MKQTENRALLAASFMMVSTVKTEAIYFSDMSVNVHQTTQENSI
jgi:hypothetical protein